MWLWLLLDAIFYTPKYYFNNRGRRIAVAALSFILVIVLFYPSAVYATYVRKRDGEWSEGVDGGDEERATEGSERTPLLAEGARG